MSKSKERQKAAASRREQLRLQQEAEARRNKIRMGIIYGLCAIVLAGIITTIGVVIHNDRENKKRAAEREAAAQVTPPSAMSDGTGYQITKDAKEGTPVLTIYQDYQCPACKSVNDHFGPIINQLAAAGKLQVQYRTLTFLDDQIGNDASFRAAMAAACADTVGSLEKYHDTVFTNQPEREGDGWTDDQLRNAFPAQAGINGDNLTKFQSCFDNKATSKWVRESNLAAQKSWLGSTPQYSINGKNPKVKTAEGKETDWWRVLDPTLASWEQAIEKYK